jgi:hypothetical protein
MMCTLCHCIFNWTTGLEEKGVVHNPHFFALSEEARAKVMAERASRGLQAPLPMRFMEGHDPFDALCTPFADVRFITTAVVASRAAFGEFGHRLVRGSPECAEMPLAIAYDAEVSGYWTVADGVFATFSSLRAAYQHTVHVINFEIDQVRDQMRSRSDERRMRMPRLARMMGEPIMVMSRTPGQKQRTAMRLNDDERTFYLPSSQFQFKVRGASAPLKPPAAARTLRARCALAAPTPPWGFKGALDAPLGGLAPP